MQPHHYNSDGRNLLTDTVANQENGIPSIRPSINVGRLPKQIPLRDCHGVEEILKIGDMVETWTNDRWIEGTFMGFNDSGLLVKLHGDMGSVSLDASFVRLAPVWINEQNSWKVTIVRIEIKDQELHKVVGVKSHNMEANNPNQVVPVCHSKAKPRKKIPEVSGLPLISADQYASRSTMLSSLIVAWSPVVQLVSELGPVDMNDSATCCSILAVGGKSGKISFWKVPEPQCFSVMSHGDSTSAFLVGLLQAHSGWITAIGWALCSSGASDPLLLLATGSSDGSVKIWLGNSGQLLKSSEVNHAPFSLLKEVETPDSVAISVVSLIVPIKSPDKLHLAVGKGSGTLDVFICDIATTSGKVDKVVSDGAHNHVVTGLAWVFDGCCLYSCSQDNSIRSWILRDNFLFEVPISPNTPAVKSSSDVCNVFDSCFGLAASPGNLMVAVVRSFDVDFLNPMYQARAQKAAVEFFWIGGQQLDRLPNEDSNFDVEKFSGFSEKELIYWTHNILWSLNQYEQVDKPLVIWDIITALLAFKQSTPEYVDHVLAKWLIPWVGTQLGPSVAKTLSHAPRFLSNMSVRQLHLMNILSRRVVLAELTAEKISYNEKNLEELSDAKEEYITSWLDLLQNSEREIRERLVAFSFSTVSSLISNSSTKFSPRCWHPVGLAQMEQWIALDRNHIQDHLKLLAGEVRKFKKSKIQSICNYVEEEQCSYCSAPVPFESTEVAFCQGADCGDGVCRSHKLFRCTASMQVCPTTPSWFCLCCQRWTSNLAPLALFRMVTYPSDIRFSTQYFKLDLLSKPLCPFCGVLLQRLQPEFILSTSPV
ncbi:hypothetical protein NMG60_11020076 [Bertholletia excelsa]